jgi:hypothetical protein
MLVVECRLPGWRFVSRPLLPATANQRIAVPGLPEIGRVLVFVLPT